MQPFPKSVARRTQNWCRNGTNVSSVTRLAWALPTKTFGAQGVGWTDDLLPMLHADEPSHTCLSVCVPCLGYQLICCIILHSNFRGCFIRTIKLFSMQTLPTLHYTLSPFIKIHMASQDKIQQLGPQGRWIHWQFPSQSAQDWMCNAQGTADLRWIWCGSP